MLPDDIASLLRRELRAGALAPGQTVNQDEFARRLGVSRVPFREALRMLAGQGLIRMRPGRRAVVTELSLGEVDELYALRLLLEPALGEAAVRQVRGTDVAALRRIQGEMNEIASQPEPDQEAWCELHYAFHRRLIELPGRHHHARVAVQVLDLLAPYARAHPREPGALRQAADRHTKMLDALEARDGSRLGGRIREGLSDARDRWLSLRR
jgi:DNA-binding GntR family transcriptional regulator